MLIGNEAGKLQWEDPAFDKKKFDRMERVLGAFEEAGVLGAFGPDLRAALEAIRAGDVAVAMAGCQGACQNARLLNPGVKATCGNCGRDLAYQAP